MTQFIYNHLKTVRSITENSIMRIKEEFADLIPPGYNNNIRWNFGHIVYVQELLAFQLSGIKQQIPETFALYFSAGTKPANWIGTPPTIDEIKEEMQQQNERIQKIHQSRLAEKLSVPYTNKGGVTFYTVGEAVLFSTYHEALHMETIKRIHQENKNRSQYC